MKTKVLDFIKNPPKDLSEKFNKAIALAVESKIPPQLLNRYNKKGATKDNVEKILYELQRFHTISKVEIAKHIPAEKEVDVVADTNVPGLRKAADLSDVQKDPFTNVLREMNSEAKSGLRFSTQYPFLKEDDAPAELKAMTVDALNSFDGYKTKHSELFDALVDVAEPKLSNEEVFSIANELLEDFEENRAVHAELEHYQKNKEILGEHEVFADLKLQREVDAVAEVDLGRKRNNVAGNITKKNAAIANKKNKDKVEELKEDLALLEKKRDLFDARISAIKEKAENVENTAVATGDAGK